MAPAKPKTKTPVKIDTPKRTEPTADKASAVEADPRGDIDQRMAALLADHQKMGARPKE